MAAGALISRAVLCVQAGCSGLAPRIPIEWFRIRYYIYVYIFSFLSALSLLSLLSLLAAAAAAAAIVVAIMW